MGFLLSKQVTVVDVNEEAKTAFFKFYGGRLDHLRIIEEWESRGSNFKTFHMEISEYTAATFMESVGILLCSFSIYPIDDKLYIKNLVINPDLTNHMKALALGTFSAYLANLKGYSKFIFYDFKVWPSLGPVDFRNLSFHKIQNKDTLNELVSEAQDLNDYTIYIRDQ